MSSGSLRDELNVLDVESEKHEAELWHAAQQWRKDGVTLLHEKGRPLKAARNHWSVLKLWAEAGHTIADVAMEHVGGVMAAQWATLRKLAKSTVSFADTAEYIIEA